MRALAFTLLLLAARADATPRWLYVYGTTDRHGALEEQHADGKLPIGGVARLATFLARARKAAPDAVLLVDSGDLFQGTMVSNLAEGAPVVDAMNALGYAATAVGNHEFDYGPVGPHIVAKSPAENPRGALQARAAEAQFPFLLANVVDAKGQRIFPAYVVVERAGTKVGIVGGVTEELPRTTLKNNLVGLTVRPLAPALAAAAVEARQQGAKVVVAIVHAGGKCGPNASTMAELTRTAPGTIDGCEDDAEVFQLARALPPKLVDAIFAGHTHQVMHAVVAGIPIGQGAPNGLGLSEIDVELDEAGQPTGNFRVPPPRLLEDPPDADMTARIAPALERARKARAAPVGVVVKATVHRAFTVESPLGNLVADALRAATATPIALMNGGGLRADLPAGNLTYGALYEVLPFDNHLAVVDMTGAELRRLLLQNLRGKKGILSISGATVRASCKAGELFVEVTLSDGTALDDARSYRVGTNDFLALGGDDFGSLQKISSAQIDEGRLMRDEVGHWLLRRRTVDPADRAIYDAAQPRLVLPGARPVVCGP